MSCDFEDNRTEEQIESTLNRAGRRKRNAKKGKGLIICEKCEVLFKDRFKIWSTCTVGVPPDLIAEGHKWI